MRAAIANTASLHTTDHYGDPIRKGYARLAVTLISNSYGHINLRLVRKALDTLTKDPTAVVKIPITNCVYGRPIWNDDKSSILRDKSGRRKTANWFELSLANDGRIRIKAPCGELRRYKLRTLDRALLTLGY